MKLKTAVKIKTSAKSIGRNYIQTIRIQLDFIGKNQTTKMTDIRFISPNSIQTLAARIFFYSSQMTVDSIEYTSFFVSFRDLYS